MTPPDQSTPNTSHPPGKSVLTAAQCAPMSISYESVQGMSVDHDATGTLAARFWAKVDRRGEADCWLWTASRDRQGYGQIQVGTRQTGKRPHRAHRISWTIAVGAIPDGLCVLHRCDVRACVNPAHLFLGTIADNNADMRAKGRSVQLGSFSNAETRANAVARLPRGDAHYARIRPERLARGEHHGATTLTEDQVREIRSERARGVALKALAKRFNLSEPGVSAIATRRTWRHVA